MTLEDINNKQFDILPYEPRMIPTPPDKLNSSRTVLISLAFFIVLFAWSFFNFKVPLLLDEVIGPIPTRDLIKGTVMALDNILAVFLQPFFGDLSDRTKSKIGRRMPFILIGTCISAVFFIIIPWVRVLAGLVLIIFFFDLAMSTFRSASIAILPDYTPEKMYSKASAIQQFVANIGGLFAFTIPIIIGFAIVGIGMFLLALIEVLKVKETPTGDKFFQVSDTEIQIDPISFRARQSRSKRDASSSRFSSYRDTLNIVGHHKDFAFFLGTVFFMYLAFASIEAFFSSFAVAYFQITEGAAGTLFLAYSGPMILSAYFVGLLGQSEKIGRKKAVKIFLGWLILSVFIMAVIVVPITYHDYNPMIIIITLVLIAIPWMGFIVNSFPILWTLAPKEKTGIYTGIYYTFNQAAYSIAPIIFGGILSIFSAFGDYRYIILFPSILALIIIAFIIFFRIKAGESRE